MEEDGIGVEAEGEDLAGIVEKVVVVETLLILKE
tara:strand:- start:520 stop:621 length:102 start_codon:yes stop_codon:yes gene_type:complete